MCLSTLSESDVGHGYYNYENNCDFWKPNIMLLLIILNVQLAFDGAHHVTSSEMPKDN
jgi:hypothetical protein